MLPRIRATPRGVPRVCRLGGTPQVTHLLVVGTAYDAKPDRPLMQLVVRTGLWVALALGCVGGAVALLRPAGGSETPAADPAAAGR